MNGVGEQRDGAGEPDDSGLGQGGHHQDGEGDLQRRDSSGAAFELRIDGFCVVVRVQAEEIANPVFEASHPRRGMVVGVRVRVIVVVRVRVIAVMRMSMIVNLRVMMT